MQQLNIFRWSREHRFAFLVTTVFGGCVGIVVGLRRIDAAAMQDYYWLWLALWVGTGALLGAAGGFVYQHLRRARARIQACNAEFVTARGLPKNVRT